MLLITDTNILIDISVAGLGERIGQLPLELAIPETVVQEELWMEPLPACIQRIVVSGEMLLQAWQLDQEEAGISVNDAIVLVLAREMDAMVATGDSNLKKVVQRKGIQCVGTIWLVQQLLEAGLMDQEELRGAIDTWKEKGRRLPWDVLEGIIRNNEEQKE